MLSLADLMHDSCQSDGSCFAVEVVMPWRGRGVEGTQLSYQQVEYASSTMKRRVLTERVHGDEAFDSCSISSSWQCLFISSYSKSLDTCRHRRDGWLLLNK